MGYYSSDSFENAKLVVSALTIGGFLLFGGIKACSKLNSNRDNFDTVKEFNAVIDYNGEGTMIAKVDNYSDYSGEVVEYSTADGLQVLTGVQNVGLVRATDYDNVYDLAVELSGGEVSRVISYDKLQNLSTRLDAYGWNKTYSLNYNFNYCIIENENGVFVKKVVSWKDWDDDDKVQVEFEDGTVILTDFTNLKLVNTEYAGTNSLYNYALALAGDESRLFGDVKKEDVKVKTR